MKRGEPGGTYYFAGVKGHMVTVNTLYKVNAALIWCTIRRRQPTRLGLTSLEKEDTTGSVERNDTDDTSASSEG